MSLESALNPLRALAHPIRWRIVALLLDRPMCVGDLAAVLELRQPRISDHLKLLREAGVLEIERRKWLRFYRVSRRCQGLILSMRNSLGISAACDPVLGADAWNAQRALRS